MHDADHPRYPPLAQERTLVQGDGTRPGEDPSSVTVAVVAICGAPHLTRCLDALAAQVDAPPFDILVIYDPMLEDVARLAETREDARFQCNEGQRTPLELASRAVGGAEGDIILLTEDHCRPDPDWVRTMRDALRPGRAAVGGLVEADPGASATDWAFYFVDFFRYAHPAAEGPSPTLTVCNVAYRRSDVDAISNLWEVYFHETAINDALSARLGDLWLHPASRVTMRRHVRLPDAVHERYVFGRLFGCTRLEFCSPLKRLYYALFAPALPVILMGRMARKGLGSPPLRGAFLRSLVPLILMVLAWFWGEWLGYLTRKHPKTLVVAQEIS